MRVRRKSEIAEAVQWDGTMENWPILSTPEDCGAVKGTWLIFRKEGDRRIWTLESPTEFAAHYEPVPDECFICHNDGTPCVHYLKAVSEEQLRPKENQVMKPPMVTSMKYTMRKVKLKKPAKAKMESLRGENNGDTLA